MLGNFGRFCHNLRAFMWRKIKPKSTFVVKNDKMRSACGQPDRKISTYFDDFPQRGCPKFDCGFYSKYLQMIAFKLLTGIFRDVVLGCLRQTSCNQRGGS